MEDKDWRIVNQQLFLQRKHLIKTQFIPTVQCDHVHCAFCWDKFGDDEQWLHIGYCTIDKPHGQRRWICEQCFQDFKDQFEWTVDNISCAILDQENSV